MKIPFVFPALLLSFLIHFSAFADVNVTRHSLDDKASYLLAASEVLPIVVVELTFPKLGAVVDSAALSGRALLAADMLMEGTAAHPGNLFRTALEDKAIKLSVAAGQDDLRISLKTLSKHLPEAMALMQELLTQPEFSKEALEKLRRKSLTTLKQVDQSPAYHAGRAFAKAAYGTHVYANPQLGTVESINALTVKQLRDWHAMISSQEIIISVAGDVSAQNFSPMMNRLLSALPKSASLPEVTEAPALVGNEAALIIERDVPQTVALFALPAVKRSDDDFYAAYVMNYILGGGGLTSRLSNEIRQQRGLAYHAGTGLSLSRFSQILKGNFATRNENALEAAQVARDTLQNYAKIGATEAEVQNAIDYITGSFALSLDSLGDKVSYLTSMQYYNLGDDYLDKRNSYFTKVSVEEVNRAAAKLLSPEPLMILVGKPAITNKTDTKKTDEQADN